MKKKQILSSTAFISSKIIATVSITLVLFLLGLIVFLSILTNNLSNYIRETLSFDIVLQDDVSSEQIQHIRNFLEQTPYTKSVTYISKDEALKQLEEDLGQNPKDFLGFNPLPNMVVVHLNARYAHVDSLAVISNQLSAFSSNIKETEYRKEIMQQISDNIAKIGFLLFVIAIILMFISFAIINNTIRLMVYSKRFLIYTMQLVGAKKSFICKPFVLSNSIIGVIAAGIACGLIYWFISYMRGNILDMDTLYNTQSLLIVFGSVFIFGILIASLSTYLAINQYVGVDVEDLYKA